MIWTRQFGTSALDVAVDVFVGSSGVYVAGVTTGALPGQSASGFSDAFVRKYDTSGTEVWTRQFGTSAFDADERGVGDDCRSCVAANT